MSVFSKFEDGSDCKREKEICKCFWDKTQFARPLAEELLTILKRKKKITTESTEEWALESPSLRKALLLWLGLALPVLCAENWTKQRWIPDKELYLNHTKSTIYAYSREEFSGDVMEERAFFINDERNKLQQHLYGIKHLIITNFGLPHRVLPPPPDYEKKAEEAIDAIVPITPTNGMKPLYFYCF